MLNNTLVTIDLPRSESFPRTIVGGSGLQLWSLVSIRSEILVKDTLTLKLEFDIR